MSTRKYQGRHSAKRDSRGVTSFWDRTLLRRVEEYVNMMPDRQPLDVETMVADLLEEYSEYNRRKRNAFSKQVARAYEFLIQEGQRKRKKQKKSLEPFEHRHLKKRARKEQESDSEDVSDSISIDEPFVEGEDFNLMNKSLNELYNDGAVPVDSPSSTPSHRQNRSTPQPGKKWIDVFSNDISSEEELAMQELNFDMDDLQEPASKQKQSKATPGSKAKTGKQQTPSQTPKKKAKTVTEAQTSNVKFTDIGGNDSTLQEICKLLVHMRHPEIYQQLGVTPPRGLLLHGPPGCGKTLLANAIAGELGLPFLKVASTEIVSGVSGESEGNIRSLFLQAEALTPCIIFIDEIDAVTPKRETAQREMERRIVAQLLACMDDLHKSECNVLVIGATNRVDSLDPALRRAGRFDREIAMGIPNENARARILKVLCRDLRLSPDFDFEYLASVTPGYVGADLMSLCREAALCAVTRIFDELQKKRPAVETGEVDVVEPRGSGEDLNVISEAVVESTTKESHPSESYIRVLSWLREQPPLTEDQMSDLCIDLSDFKISPLPSYPEDEDIFWHNQSDTQDEPFQIQMVAEGNQEDIITGLENPYASDSFEEEQLQLTDDERNSLLFEDENEDDEESSTEETEESDDDGDNHTEEALPFVQPSAKREGFATIPDVTWDDVGALENVREELTLAIVAPVRNPEAFKALGLTNPPGILLAGPPGCGKTLLAKAIANESGINFISVKGPELMNMYVGESERAVRQCFDRARNSAPCVIFFDELDALCPKRNDSSESGSTARVVNQLLTEMDGLESRKQVFIMGATNRPDIIDPAILRPGRMDKIIYVGIPSREDRVAILKTITKNGTKPLLSDEVSLANLGSDPRCDRFTGADVASLVREASLSALQQVLKSPSESFDSSLTSIKVNKDDFEKAFRKVKPSVSMKDLNMYNRMRVRILRGSDEEELETAATRGQTMAK